MQIEEQEPPKTFEFVQTWKFVAPQSSVDTFLIDILAAFSSILDSLDDALKIGASCRVSTDTLRSRTDGCLLWKIGRGMEISTTKVTQTLPETMDSSRLPPEW